MVLRNVLCFSDIFSGFLNFFDIVYGFSTFLKFFYRLFHIFGDFLMISCNLRQFFNIFYYLMYF